MRKFLGTALVLGLATLAATAHAQMAQDARVTQVDRTGKAFSAQWYTGSSNFWTTPKTTFHVGSQPTNFDYIKAGMTVRVSSHMEGDKAIVDDLVFTQ